MPARGAFVPFLGGSEHNVPTLLANIEEKMPLHLQSKKAFNIQLPVLFEGNHQVVVHTLLRWP